MDISFYKKKILVTGHTGFKGWLNLLLTELRAEVMGIFLTPKTSRNFYLINNLHRFCDSHICNISDYQTIQKKILEFQPDLVFHLAAQLLVRYSYMNLLETYQTNVMGTANLLESIKNIQPKCAIALVTTDKIYHGSLNGIKNSGIIKILFSGYSGKSIHHYLNLFES